nr:MAG: glycoprotein [Taraxacum betanucleorhabdovirus 1]
MSDISLDAFKKNQLNCISLSNAGQMGAVSLIIALLQITYILTASDPTFDNKRNLAYKYNPVYQAKDEGGYGQEAYQPYYICEPDNDDSAMPLSAWHYSCKEACMTTHRKQTVNITGARWNYIGPEIDVFKVLTTEVCYTSHENIWGYCSQTQTTRPVKTLNSDRAIMPANMFGTDSPAKYGTHYITNSKEAECSYTSDNTECARDYQVMRRVGRVSKKHSDSDAEMTIVVDGIRTDPRTGFLELDDVAWFWSPMSLGELSACGWEKTNRIVCTFTDSTDIISCPSIGYTYNIQALYPKKTCAGDIYETTGPFPFFYDTFEYYPSRDDVYSKAKEGKPDPDISLIDGINKAFTDFELAYCSSACDLFARQGDPDEDHVLDTPVGTWRFSTNARGRPSLLPCMPTNKWHLGNPTTLCHGKNHLLVVDTETGHPGSWDARKDYIISGEVCNTDQSVMTQDDEDLRDQIARGETINITFWTGDVLQIKPPYDGPVWVNGSKAFRLNPSWFSHVKLTRDMMHTRDDVTLLLTDMVRNTTTELMYNKVPTKTLRRLIADEILSGAESIYEAMWKVLSSLFGGVAKIIMIGTIIFLVFCILKLTSQKNNKRGKRKASQPQRVTFQEAPASLDPMPLVSNPGSALVGSKRKVRKELQNLLMS